MCPNGTAPTVDTGSREVRDRSEGDPVQTRGNDRRAVAVRLEAVEKTYGRGDNEVPALRNPSPAFGTGSFTLEALHRQEYFTALLNQTQSTAERRSKRSRGLTP